MLLSKGLPVPEIYWKLINSQLFSSNHGKRHEKNNEVCLCLERCDDVQHDTEYPTGFISSNIYEFFFVTCCAGGKRFLWNFDNRVLENLCPNLLSLTIEQLSLVTSLCLSFAGFPLFNSLWVDVCHYAFVDICLASCCSVGCLHVSYRLHQTVVMNFVHENTFSVKICLPRCAVEVSALTR